MKFDQHKQPKQPAPPTPHPSHHLISILLALPPEKFDDVKFDFIRCGVVHHKFTGVIYTIRHNLVTKRLLINGDNAPNYVTTIDETGLPTWALYV